MTRYPDTLLGQITRDRDLSLDIARDWIRRAKLGEFSDGTLMTKADQSVFVAQGRRLQWNALHVFNWKRKQLARKEVAA